MRTSQIERHRNNSGTRDTKQMAPTTIVSSAETNEKENKGQNLGPERHDPDPPPALHLEWQGFGRNGRTRQQSPGE